MIMIYEIMIFERVSLERAFLCGYSLSYPEEKRIMKIFVEPILYTFARHRKFIEEES